MNFNLSEKIARELVSRDTDPNEISSVVAFIGAIDKTRQDSSALFQYLDTVISDGHSVVRSGRTLTYYRNIRTVCKQYLDPDQHDLDFMAQTLGWAVRLMRYYQIEDRLEQPPPRQTSQAQAPEAETDRQTGKVKWFNPDRGFGFIQPDQGRKDVFVHISHLGQGLDTLSPGQRVTFIVEQSVKGLQAQDVRLA